MYRITNKTLAITPYHQTKILETEKEVLSYDAPLEII
ncbi:competence protein ComK [Gracilibacillus massiliensis]|nr:competence protein ComK [Gracilibacillus massiliensis]